MFGIHLHLNLFIIIVNLFFSAYSENPITIFCADPKCSELVSKAQGAVKYTAAEKHFLNFNKGTAMYITGKNKGKDGYWSAKIGNNIGLVPSNLVREIQVWKSMDMLKYKVQPFSESDPSMSSGNKNLDKTKSQINLGKGSESQIPEVTQSSPNSPMKIISQEVIHSTSDELLSDAENPQLMNSGQKTTQPVNNIASGFPQAEVVTENSSSVSMEEIGVPNVLETGEKIAEKLANDTSSQINSSEKKEDFINNETPESDKGKVLVTLNSNSQSREKVSHEEIKSGEAIGTETTKNLFKSNVNINMDQNEISKEHSEIKIVNLKENENNNSVDSSNNSKTSGSDNEAFANSELEDEVEKPYISEKSSMNIVTEPEIDSTEIPIVVEDTDLSFIPEKDISAEPENKQSTNVEQHQNNNILHSHNSKVDDQAHLNSETGTVDEVDQTSVKLDVNVDLNEILAQGSEADVGTFVSSNSSSNNSKSSVALGISSASDGSVNDIHVEPGNDNSEESFSPSHHYQVDSDIHNKPERLNTKESQLGHIPLQGKLQNSFDSAGTPKPSSEDISQGHESSHVGSRENSNIGMMPLSLPSQQVHIDISNSGSVPPPMVINNDINQALRQQFVASTSASVQDVNIEQQSVNKDPYSATAQEQYSRGKQPDRTYELVPPTPEPLPPTYMPSEVIGTPEINTENIPNKEDAIRGHVQHEVSTQSPPEIADTPRGVPDTIYSTERPSENSVYEFLTPVPSLDVVTDSYQNIEEKTVENAESEVKTETRNEGGFLSSLGETVLGWVGLRSEKQESETEKEQGNRSEETVSGETPSSDAYFKAKINPSDETCRESDDNTINCSDESSDENNSVWSFWLDNKTMAPVSSYNTFIYLVVTAVTVLLFTLGYYFIEKFRSDGPLIAKVNRLEQELLVSSKECLILKDELVNTKEKLSLFETSSNDKIITSLQQELEEAKKTKADLENNIEVLQQELDAATEAGLDLNKMLTEVLTQKGGSETLMESVEHLQAQLNNQQKIIDEMTSKLFTKTNENQELQDELAAATEKIESLEGEIEDMRVNLNVHLKDNENIIKDLTSKNNELQIKLSQTNEAKEKETAKLKKNVSELDKNLKAMSDSLKIKEEECNNLKDSVKKIKVKDGKSIDSLFEASRIKAELNQATSENSSLKDRLKMEEDKLTKLDGKVKKLEEEIQKLKHISSEAEKEKTEAQTRLEVLSNYFKEKETQLQKELGLREAMWVQKQGDDSTIFEKMRSLEEEIYSYKSQNEALKKEILDQERGLKAQITTLEKKAHENWIAARQAERKLEESKQEAAQLRNKMTLMEKNISNDLESSQHHRVNDELNGGDALSPLIHDTSSPILFPPPLPLDPNNSSLMPPGFIPPPMFMPPPPGGFMPPPPPFLPGDHRPPPLGRMSSPPLNNRFSPPPPDYAYDRMSTPPLSPSNRNYRSPNESDRDRERYRHRTPTSPSFRSRNWEEGPSVGMSGFRPITSERESRREHKGGSNLSSGHSSDSLDKSSRHSSRV